MKCLYQASFSYFLNYIDDSLIFLYTGQPGGFLGLLSSFRLADAGVVARHSRLFKTKFNSRKVSRASRAASLNGPVDFNVYIPKHAHDARLV